MPDNHEHHIHPQVKLADQVQPLEKKPKVLGVTLYIYLIFTQHCNNMAVIVQQRNNVLKSLAGFTWGCDKETLLTSYQAIGRSIRSYYCPVWTPSPKDTNWSWLQRAQNSSPQLNRDTTTQLFTTTQQSYNTTVIRQHTTELQTMAIYYKTLLHIGATPQRLFTT